MHLMFVLGKHNCVTLTYGYINIEQALSDTYGDARWTQEAEFVLFLPVFFLKLEINEYLWFYK